ncbi:MAG: hypothetical protein J5809_06895 [Selenomonadaceae bacterium]|nr:hypothetical protein [Selenomonadaceae bacterium]
MAAADEGLIYNNTNTTKATAVTVTAEYTGTSLKASGYSASVVVITAERDKPINIEGNAKANKIFGTAADDTINGAAGNDTLTGNGGADIFIYDGKGNDVIADYTADEDTLRFSSGSISGYSFSGSDAVFKVGSGSVKVLGGKSREITVIDFKNKILVYTGGLIYSGAPAKASAMTVTAACGNTLSADSYGAAVVTIDSSARTSAINLTGNSKSNRIIGTSGNDTIGGGAGNDALAGGSGKDIFVYESGNDVIEDYAAGQDTIQISGEISDYSISGSDAILKIGTGSIKVKGGKSSAILVVDANKTATVFQGGAIYNNATPSKAAAVTLTASYGSSLTAGSAVVTVDASPRTSAVKIFGNAKNNFLTGGSGKDVLDGGKGSDTLSGGRGNDTLTGGSGSDVFVYADGDGSDLITDYTSGEDLIKLASGAVKGYSVKNGDAILKIGNGAVTLRGAGMNAVSVLDAADVLTVYQGGLIYNNAQISRADAVTVTADFEGEFNSYGASVETIDAAARTKAIDITGNGADNFILGGKGKDTISGGKGADTISGGKGNDLLTGGAGADVFYFSTGDGSNTITDYAAGEDIISVDGAVTGYSVNGGDAILKLDSGNIAVQGAADLAITVVGSDSIASVYTGEEVSTETWTTDVTVTMSGSEILGTDGDDTLAGTAENDTFTGYAGADVFVYEGGGDFDVITDYGGGDKISIGANSVGGGMVVGSDVFFEINGGVLKVLDAKNKAVTFLTEGGELEYFNGSFLGRIIELTEGNDVYTNTESRQIIYALAGSDEISNEHGASSVTINSGAGRDTIRNYGAGGNVYWLNAGDGASTVIGFNENDTICLASDAYTTSKSGEDFVVKSGADSFFLRHAANFPVTIKDSTGSVQTCNGDGSRVVSGDNLSTDIVNTNSRATINGSANYNLINNYGAGVQIFGGAGVDYITSYGASVTIDAGAEDDYIWNYGAGATIDAGRGNDRIYLNSGGGNVLQYASGDGNDVVYNFSANDTVEISGGSYSTIASGENLIVSVGSGMVNLLGAGLLSAVNILGEYDGGNGNAAVPWFAEDDADFDTGGLGSLLENSSASSSGELSMRGGDSLITDNFTRAIQTSCFQCERSRLP